MPVASLLFLLAAGCSVVHTESGSGPSVTAALRASVPTQSSLSVRTTQELYRRDLLSLFPDSLDDLTARLHADALADPDPALLFALAEVNYTRGRKAERNHDSETSLYYFRAAGYAYHFLFGSSAQMKSSIAPFDPRFRIACDLYNTALARCLVLEQVHGLFDPRGQWRLPGQAVRGETAPQEVVHVGFNLQPGEFGSLLVCAGYRVVGLATLHRTFGLGVPLIGQRNPDAPADRFVLADINFPVTALCRFEGGLDDLIKTPRARLELINPLTIASIKISGHEVPLESDVTTPLAHYLGQAHLEQASYRGFFSPDKLGQKGGLHFFEPYQAGKVPVILVHGLLGSPATWASLLNDLLADPLVRQRFQFAVFFYPTGESYLATAADLRGDLERYRQTVDPDGKNPLLDEMVVVGHSMGGLIGRLLTVDGGDDFWRLISPEPMDRLKMPPPARQELRRTYYFHRQSCVRRVIFMGTPHRGSKISPSLLGRLAARIAGVPRQMLDATHEVAKLNPQVRESACQVSSIALMAPDTPALALLANRPQPPGVHYHSVIGVSLSNSLFIEHLCGGDGKAGDGVVPYESAHLDGVDSELVVQANHYRVHQHPLSIREVRRILQEHLKAIAR